MTEQFAEPTLNHAHGDRLAVGAVEHVERDYLGAFDRSHALSVRWGRAHCLGLVLTVCAARLNTYSELHAHWWAVLGLNQFQFQQLVRQPKRSRSAPPWPSLRLVVRDAGDDSATRVYGLNAISHVSNIAALRLAAGVTQVQVADALGVGQGSVSRIEHQSDLLLSTLASYLTALGVHAQIVVEVAEQTVKYDLTAKRRAR
jgi:DNA-binding XRE family transcriptional regulator